MKRFAELITELDQTTKTNVRLEALVRYFEASHETDILWAVALFTGRRPKRPMTSTRLREWAAEHANIPLWLFEESYHIVGDLAETIALMLPPNAVEPDEQRLSDWITLIRSMQGLEEEAQKDQVFEAWERLNREGRFVFNKLLTGGFRIGVSQKMMTKALARYLDKDEAAIAHRLMGNWHPDDTSFDTLLRSDDQGDDLSKPYPFYLAYALEEDPDGLGDPAEWQAEWKWDGIRGQVIVRDDVCYVWSRGEELVTDKYPEYAAFADALPNGTVIDGEILAYRDGVPLNFHVLQTRIGRKTVGKKILEEAPVVFMAYDLLEWEGKDIREEPLTTRREHLETLVKQSDGSSLLLSPVVAFDDWASLTETRTQSREYYAEGLMLKRKSAPYQVGRKRGDWWKWKVDPLTIDAVMIYAMRGHGRRANLYTDYTFAAHDGGQLVPFTKAYSGLTDKEFRAVDAFVKQNTIERFGPVRSVTPELVFEIAFEGIAESKRHKSGVALRFPRMKRWRKDKKMEEANTLDDLKALLKQYG